MRTEIPSHRPKLASRLGASHSILCLSADARRIIYTTNAIEALNSKLRRAVRARGHFPSDEAASELLYLILLRSCSDPRKNGRCRPENGLWQRLSSPFSSVIVSFGSWRPDVQPPSRTRNSGQARDFLLVNLREEAAADARLCQVDAEYRVSASRAELAASLVDRGQLGLE